MSYDNYPPGVTGNERAIAGPSREEERAEEEATETFWDSELGELIADRSDEIAELIKEIWNAKKDDPEILAGLYRTIENWLEEYIEDELEKIGN